MLVIHELEQGSAEWLDFRKERISATDIPVILGISPYKSPYMLFLEKFNLKESDPDNFAMRRGRDLEPLALAKYCHVKQLYNVKPVVVTHPDYPWAMASIDGISEDLTQICEIKCMGSTNHNKAMEGYIDPCHYAQMQWQMFCTGLKSCDYFVFSMDSFKLIPVDFCELFIQDALQKAMEFLRCLRSITAPPFSKLDVEDKSNDDYWIHLEKAYIMYDKQEKEAQSAKEQIKDKMEEYYQGRSLKGEKVLFTRVERQGTIDYGSIPELKNIDLEKYRKPVSFSFRVTIS